MLNLSLDLDRGYVRLLEISKKENISEKYLENIVTSIKTTGLLDVKRGSRGGYRLLKSPSQIKLIELFEVLDNTFLDFSNVPDHTNDRAISNQLIDEVWTGLKDSIKTYLASKTLADLVEEYKKLNNNQNFVI